MTDTPHDRQLTTNPALGTVRAAIADLGDATAAAIGAKAGLAYSTTTPRLRALEEAGEAERFRADDNRTLWRLTDAGRAALTGPYHQNEPNPPRTTSAPEPAPGSPGVVENQPAPDPGADVAVAAKPAPTAAITADAHDADENSAAPTADAVTDADAGSPGVVAETGGDSSQPLAAVAARRAKGTLDGAVLDVLEAEPGRVFKVSELCKLIDAANDGSDVRKASPGAVVLAAHRLVTKGRAVLVVEHPASFQLHPPT
ncbi:MarR family transcriptional regulator [Asanoa sp. NPDC049518]|uniref:MarR family transcriptional regulator n=1 Tax=unclassified Asanoa TaxID=2685164 RepID=UPI00344A3AEC